MKEELQPIVDLLKQIASCPRCPDCAGLAKSTVDILENETVQRALSGDQPKKDSPSV